jgi:hypothetical protein
MEPASELNTPLPMKELPSEDTSGSSDNRDAPMPAEENYLSGFKLAVIMAALLISNFFVALDTTILSTAIPRISTQFNSLQDVGWYVSAYLLTNCAFQLLYGKLYTHFGVKTIFVAAMTIFEIGSLLNAVAPNSPVFILGRAIAGLGSAGVFSGGKFLNVLLSLESFQEGIDSRSSSHHHHSFSPTRETGSILGHDSGYVRNRIRRRTFNGRSLH